MRRLIWPSGILSGSSALIAALIGIFLSFSTASAGGLDGFENWLAKWSLDLGASASFDRLETTRSEVIIQGFTLESRRLEFSLRISTARLSGLKTRIKPNSVATADSITLEGVLLRFGDLELTSDAISLDNVTLPRLASTPTLGASLFERKLTFAKQALMLEAGAIKTDKVAIHTYADGSADERLATAIYRNAMLENMVGQTIGSATALNSISTSTPIEPMLTETTGRIELQNLQLSTLLTLFDGQANSTSAPFLGGFTLLNYRLNFGGIETQIGRTVFENVHLGATSAALEQQILSTFEGDRGLDAIADNKRATFMLDLLALPQIDIMRFEDVRAETLGVEEFHLNELDLTGFSVGGLSTLRLSEFHVQIREIGRLDLTGFYLDGLTLPDLTVIKQAMNGDATGAKLLPSLDGLGLNGLEAFLFEPFDLTAELNTAQFGFQGSNETILVSQVNGLRLPASLLPTEGPLALARAVLNEKKLDMLSLSHEMKLSYDPAADRLGIDRLTLTLPELADLTISGAISGLDQSPFQLPRAAVAALRKGRLSSLEVAFENAGAVEAAFDVQAKRLNTDGATMRSQVGATLPFLLGVLQNPPFQQQLATALRAFLPQPEGLRIQIAPNAPVPISDLERQLRRDPRQLIKLLGLSVENAPRQRSQDQSSDQVAPQSPN